MLSPVWVAEEKTTECGSPIATGVKVRGDTTVDVGDRSEGKVLRLHTHASVVCRAKK